MSNFMINPYIYGKNTISTHPTLLTNLIYYHKADVNGTYLDETANNHDGTITGATYTASGKINGAYSYGGGSSDYITMADSTDFDHAAGFTSAFWVKFTSLTNLQFMVYRGDTSSQNLFSVAKIADNTIQFVIYTGGVAASVFSNSAVTTGVWYRMIARRNSSNLMELFINNVKQTDNATKSGTINPTGTPSYTIGASRVPSGSTNGIIDETASRQRALTDAEIADDWNSGNGLPYD